MLMDALIFTHDSFHTLGSLTGKVNSSFHPAAVLPLSAVAAGTLPQRMPRAADESGHTRSPHGPGRGAASPGRTWRLRRAPIGGRVDVGCPTSPIRTSLPDPIPTFAHRRAYGQGRGAAPLSVELAPRTHPQRSRTHARPHPRARCASRCYPDVEALPSGALCTDAGICPCSPACAHSARALRARRHTSAREVGGSSPSLTPTIRSAVPSFDSRV